MRQDTILSRLLPLHHQALVDGAALLRSSLDGGGLLCLRGERTLVDFLQADIQQPVRGPIDRNGPDDAVVVFTDHAYLLQVSAHGSTVRIPSEGVTGPLLRRARVALWYELLDRLDAPAGDVTEPDDLAAACGRWRAAGLTVVWTNGCFDLVHAGHVWLLESARALGDVLIVGLNTDRSIRGLKGAERPFVPFEQRIRLLRGLRAVDHVIPLRGDTPCEEIGLLRPDVCVKDDSYRTLPLPEREMVEAYGGRMELLPRMPGLSSTGLANRIRTGRSSA